MEEVGNALSKAKDGQPVARSMQEALELEARRLSEHIDDIRATNPAEKLAKADALSKTNPGQKRYKSDELDGPAKNLRKAEEDIAELKNRSATLNKYVTVNRIASDATKFGLRTGGNVFTAGATTTLYSAPGAPEGQEDEAAVESFKTGLAIGAPFVGHSNRSGKLVMNRDAMLKKGKALV